VSYFPLLSFIDAIYVINLEYRTDRRSEMHKQLARIGLDYNHPKVKLFPASRPDTAGEFPNIGTRGCFLSHLNILKNARIQGHNCILILEDDADFTARFCNITESDTSLIIKTQWDMFYLGSQYSPNENADDDYGFFTSVLPVAPLKLTHSILLKKTTILEMVPYLESMLARKIGDPLGGPMHIDGAYSWFRKEHSDIKTMATKSQWVVQRASRTDIHDTGWKEHIPFINMARQIKNKLIHR